MPNTYVCYVDPPDSNRYGRATIEAESSFAARREYVRRYPESDLATVCAVASRYMGEDPSSDVIRKIPAAPMPAGFIDELRKGE